MSDGRDSSQNERPDSDTLPMGHEVAKAHVLETIVDTDWQSQERGSAGPDEGYQCEVGDCGVRLERDGRIWRGSLELPDEELRQTDRSEDIGKVARQLKALIEAWRAD